jgi:Ca-activated chloride channel family protein
MAKRKRKGKPLVLLIFVAAVAIWIGYSFLEDSGINLAPRMSYDTAAAKLEKTVGKISWSERFTTGGGTVVTPAKSLEESLPPINTFPLAVNPRGAGQTVVEIFVSTEKSGSGTDGWMVEAANEFNGLGKRLQNGQTAAISIRKIASGTGYQFIASGTHVPDAYSPSNHLWVRMAEGRGRKMTPVLERTVGNIAGIVMKTEVAEEIKSAAGTLSTANIVDAVVQGRLGMGYTNPYASSTGLNFLVSVLASFSGGDEAKMLSPEVASAFEAFQRGVPFVAMTTLQMRDSVEQDGSLDAFVMEYQTYVKTDVLRRGYEFIPFGQPHDNPLYAVGDPGAAKTEALKLFAAFLQEGKQQKRASEYGFNPKIDHKPPFALPSGQTLIAAQKLWKEKKDAGQRIVAVFLGDVSGSMDGSRLAQLKRALIEGSSFISPENSIGLVVFSDQVTVRLPIRPFKLVHKSGFHSAVRGLRAGGGTAMYDGVAVALSMLVEEKRKDPDVKVMLLVLTDGQTNRGLDYGDVSRIIEGLQIPVYTIGFEANIDELGRLSALVEAASINAGEADLRYKIGSLLNSQM